MGLESQGGVSEIIKNFNIKLFNEEYNASMSLETWQKEERWDILKTKMVEREE